MDAQNRLMQEPAEVNAPAQETDKAAQAKREHKETIISTVIEVAVDIVTSIFD